MYRFIVLIVLINSFLFAQIGIVKKVKGTVEVKRNKKVIIVKKGMSLKNRDVILTKVNSSVGITFDDGSRLSLGDKAIFVINEFRVKPSKNSYNVDLNLKKGKAVFSSGKVGKLAPKAVKFRIPEGIIGIRGTKFAVEVK